MTEPNETRSPPAKRKGQQEPSPALKRPLFNSSNTAKASTVLSSSSSRPPQRPSGVAPPQRPPAIRPVAAGTPNSTVNRADSASTVTTAASKSAATSQRIISKAVAPKVQ
jgi:hypothetical protein